MADGFSVEDGPLFSVWGREEYERFADDVAGEVA